MDFSRQKALDFLRYGSLRLNENQLVTPALDHRVILYSVNQILREINIAHRRVLTGDIGVLIKENDPVWVRVVYRSGFLGSNRLGPVRNVIVAGNVVILEGLPAIVIIVVVDGKPPGFPAPPWRHQVLPEAVCWVRRFSRSRRTKAAER